LENFTATIDIMYPTAIIVYVYFYIFFLLHILNSSIISVLLAM